MQALRLFQEVPDTGLSWLFYALLGIFLLVIIVGSLTQRRKNVPTPEPEPEARKSPRKTNRSTGVKHTRK
jgi:LPXTG-motif cell wall-anchored protein